jgi:hypothetical protein
MNQLSEGSRGGTVPSHRSLDLILQARALRYQWLAAAPARLSARLTRLRLAARARPGWMPRPAAHAARPLADRPAI